MTARPLTIEEIEEAAQGFKEDLQRAANRAVRQKGTDKALAALESIEAINSFVYTLKMRAGSDLHRAAWPARARSVHIPAGVNEASKKRAKKAKKEPG